MRVCFGRGQNTIFAIKFGCIKPKKNIGNKRAQQNRAVAAFDITLTRRLGDATAIDTDVVGIGFADDAFGKKRRRNGNIEFFRNSHRQVGQAVTMQFNIRNDDRMTGAANHLGGFFEAGLQILRVADGQGRFSEMGKFDWLVNNIVGNLDVARTALGLHRPDETRMISEAAVSASRSTVVAQVTSSKMRRWVSNVRTLWWRRGSSLRSLMPGPPEMTSTRLFSA